MRDLEADQAAGLASKLRIGIRLTGHCFALAVIGSGCAPKNKDSLHFLRSHEHEVSAIEYRLGIPDSIAVDAPRVEEIHGENQTIQPDGKINLRLLGEVKVVDMTAKEVAAKLELLLSRYYVDPKVSVRVSGYHSKKYYVYGQVGAQGPHVYTGRDTLLDAVLKSGVNHTSWTSKVTVTRPSAGEVPVRIIRVDVDQMVKAGDWSKNILLEPDDVVHVPPTPFAWMGQKVNSLISPVSPVAQLYLTPAQIEDANEEYTDDEDNYND